MPAIDPVILELQAKTGKAEADLKGYENTARNTLNNIAANIERMADAFEKGGDRVVRSGKKIKDTANDNSKSLNAIRIAGVGAGQQLQDMAVQFQSGTRASTILAQQLPQLAFALSGLEGNANKTADRIGKFAAFMSGPYGLAINLAVVAGGALIASLTGTAEAEKEAEKAAKEHKKALDDLNDKADDLVRTEYDRANALAQEAAQELKSAIATRERNKALLEQAQALLAVQRVRATAPGQRGEIATLGVEPAANRVAGLEASIAKNNAEIERLGQTARVLGNQAAAIVGDQLSTAEGKIERVYQARRKALLSEAKDRATVQQSIIELNKWRDAELEKIKEATKKGHSGKSESEKEAEAAQRQTEGLRDRITMIQQELQLQNLITQGREQEAAILAAKWELERQFPKVDAELLQHAIDMSRQLIVQKQLWEDIAKAKQDALKEKPDLKASAVKQGDIDAYVTRFLEQNRQLLESVDFTSAQIEEALGKVRERAIDNLTDGLTDAITGAESLGDAFSRVADQIIHDLVRIAVQQAIIKPLESLLGGDGGGGGGGFLGGIGSGFGSIWKAMSGFAGGGYAAPNSISRVNEQNGGVELLRMGPQGGTVIPLGQAQQTLSSPNSGQPGVATVQLMLSDDIDARIVNVSGPVAVEVVRSAAPDIVNAASNETLRRAGRRTM